jgi:diguanylate cyclase (GGDEF)-like protein
MVSKVRSAAAATSSGVVSTPRTSAVVHTRGSPAACPHIVGAYGSGLMREPLAASVSTRSDARVDGYVFHLAGEAPRLGDEVGALGFPLGLPLTATKGSVSGLDRAIEIEGTTRRKLVQTDAAVNPGNSGGPLIALGSGRVVGLVDAGSNKVNGIAFAVNSKVAAALVQAWKAAPQPIAAETCGGSDGSSSVASGSGGGAGAVDAATADDRAYSDAVDDALINSARTRRGLGELIASVNNGSINYEQASGVIMAITEQRRSLLAAVENASAPPAFATAAELLKASLNASISDDLAIASWIDAIYSGDDASARGEHAKPRTRLITGLCCADSDGMGRVGRHSDALKETRPIGRVAAIGVLTFLATGFRPVETDWWLVLVAAAVAAAIVLVSLLAPWRRLPAWTYVLPPLAVFVLIALLRQAQGGSSSGYGVLGMLPVVWVALKLGRGMVVLCAGAAAAVFAVPILVIGAPLYPSSGLRGALLWFAVALVVGLVVNEVVGEQRRQARAAAERARDLSETQDALAAVARVAREIAAGLEPRGLICATALDACFASVATIVEPTADGSFEITGSAGVPIEIVELRQSVRPSASLHAYFALAREFIADVSSNPGVSQLFIQATGLASVLYEPILRHGKPVGVLSIGWSTPRSAVDERTGTIAAFLAAEAGAAIERADLVARLDTLARTDELTGLPNRRAWDEALAQTLENREDVVCLALLDLDHFKAFNDTNGHLAGDRLLQEAAILWRAQLRDGDLLARIGGEEFAVMLPSCSQQQATAVLERLRAATPSATCSIGLAEYTGQETADELTLRADKALYTAKNKGRNQLIAA